MANYTFDSPSIVIKPTDIETIKEITEWKSLLRKKSIHYNQRVVDLIKEDLKNLKDGN